MPSRKRNQGKQRKAKAAAATTTSTNSEALLLSEQDKLAELINSLSLNKCEHGRPALADIGDACKLFMTEFEKALVQSAGDDEIASLFKRVLHFTADQSVLLTVDQMEQAKKCLLALGADCLLDAVPKQQYACAIAMAVLYCEDKGGADVIMSSLGNPIVMQKIGNLMGGGVRETVSFFSKRLACSCLKGMYDEVKVDKKTAVCCHCRETKERKTLMVCSICKIAQYCSATCQKNDWPEHKNECKKLRSCWIDLCESSCG